MSTTQNLNGWQRLWVVLTVLYGIGVLSLVVFNYPSRSDVVKHWAISVLKDWDDFMFSGSNEESMRRRKSLSGLEEWIYVRYTEGMYDKISTETLEKNAFGNSGDSLLNSQETWGQNRMALT